MTPYNLVHRHKCLKETCCLLLPDSSTLKLEVAVWSKMSVPIYQTECCHILEDCVCFINCCENHRVFTVIVLLLLLYTICKVKSTHKCPINILFHYCVLTFVLQRILDFNTCCGCFLDVEVFTAGCVTRKLAN